MTIDELSENLSLWRKNKKSIRERIPEEYLEEAAKLANESSASAIASKLGLGMADLKKRMKDPLLPKEKVIFKELLPSAPQNNFFYLWNLLLNQA